LFNLVSDHTFPTLLNNSVASSVTSFASSFIKAGASERNTTKEVLNCIRILQRVLPVVFEIDSETSVFEQEIFWKENIETRDVEETTEQTPQFVIEDDDEDGAHGEGTEVPSPMASTIRRKEKKSIPSLAERLFSCLVDLLFCCGFTLPSKIQVDHYKINYIIW